MNRKKPLYVHLSIKHLLAGSLSLPLQAPAIWPTDLPPCNDILSMIVDSLKPIYHLQLNGTHYFTVFHCLILIKILYHSKERVVV